MSDALRKELHHAQSEWEDGKGGVGAIIRAGEKACDALSTEREKVARLTAENERMREAVIESRKSITSFLNSGLVEIVLYGNDGFDKQEKITGKKAIEICEKELLTFLDEAALSPAPAVAPPTVCRWKCTGEIIGADSMAWQIGCTGKDITIGGDGGPKQAGLNYCSHCGLPIEEVKE